jgi:hypothetical protein
MRSALTRFVSDSGLAPAEVQRADGFGSDAQILLDSKGSL